MKLLSLELTNYRPFKHQLIDFNRDGVIGIIGRNGVGKTTIVEAIMWSLYGDFRQVRTDRQDIRLQNADEEEPCEVVLEIQLAGHLCKIDRMLRGKEQKHEVKLYLDNQTNPCEQSIEGVRVFMENLIGLDCKNFHRTIYAKQKEIQALADDKETRTRQIDTLLEIEKIKDTIQQIKDDQKIASIQISEKERVLPNISDLEAELEEARQKLHQISNSLHSTQNILDDIEKELELAKQSLKVSEQKKATAESLEKEIERITEKRETLKQQLSDELEPEKCALEALQSEFQAIERKLTEFENVKVSLAHFDDAFQKYHQKQELTEKLKAAKIQLQQQRSLIAKARAQADKYPLEVECLTTMEEEIEQIRDALEQARFERDELKDQFHAVVNTIQKVNAHLEEKSRLEAQLTTLQQNISKFRDQYVNLGEEAKNLRARQQELMRVQYSFERLLQQGSKLLAERKRKKEDLTYAKTHREEIIKQGKDSACPQCKRPYGEHYTDILAGYEKEIAGLATELNELEEAIRSNTLVKNSETKKVKQLQAEVAMLNRTAGTVDIIRKTIANLQQEAEQTNQRLKTLQDEIETVWSDFQPTPGPSGEGKVADFVLPQDFLENLTSQSQELQENILGVEDSILSYEEELDEKVSLMTAQIERVHKLKSLLDQINIHQRREVEIHESVNEFEGRLAEIGDVDYDESAHTACKEKYESLRKDYEKSLGLKEQLKRLPIVQNRISDAISEIEAHETRIKAITDCLNELSFSTEEHQQIVDKVEKLEKQYHEFEVQIAAFKRDEAFAQTNFDRLNGELAEAKQGEQEIEDLRRQLEMLSKLEELMSRFREWYSAQLRPQVENEASDLLLSMTQGKYPRIQLSSDYQISVYDGSRFHSVYHYSGGEIDLVNLCLRIALTRIAARKRGVELGIIILDEIFGSQDQERRQELLTQFRQMHNYFRQVLLITHVDDIAAGFVDHLLRVTRSDEGISYAEFE
jgi:exonuclease SbcC